MRTIHGCATLPIGNIQVQRPIGIVKMQPSPPLNKIEASRRLRRILALVGLLLILASILLLISFHRTPQREQIHYDPPATLFAPPGAEP
ncbi:MAG: hypothetical protein A2Z14_06895 [Chloroflexi bacterium RBG_16_48_8]|nr:MAG: hypothetical protein A2Z14_06895 [Chloroflexi bacterium RBG_16_48_8]